MQKFSNGIDVSWHRGDVRWPEVKASGIDFAFVKATEGISFLDSRFFRNWGEMRRAGILRGAYHFFRPALDPAQQAAHFLNTVGEIMYAFDLPPVLDVENSPSFVRQEFMQFPLENRQQRVLKWLQIVEQNTGRTPIIYTNPDTWQTSLGNSSKFSRFPLWIANYNVAAPFVPGMNWGGRGWTFWQFTDRALVPGVNQGLPPTDQNRFRGNRNQLLEFMGIANPPALPLAITFGHLRRAITAAAAQCKVDLHLVLQEARLEHLTRKSLEEQPYDGFPPSEFLLAEPLKSAMLTQIDLVLAGDSVIEAYPLYRLTNQEVINSVYRAASDLAMAGWQLLVEMRIKQTLNGRHSLYTGPRLDQMVWLDKRVKIALVKVFGLENSPEEPFPAHYSGVTNQDVINSVYRLAALRGVSGWKLLTQLKFEYLVAARQANYIGPAVETWEGLTAEESNLLRGWMGQPEKPSISDAHYPGLINQDMINIFYQAASLAGTTGWGLLGKAGLTGLANSPASRNSPYTGAAVGEISGLSASERAILSDLIAQR